MTTRVRRSTAEFQSSKFQSLKVQTFQIQSFKVQSLKVQSLKFQNANYQSSSLKFQNANYQSSKFQSSKFRSSKFQSSKFRSQGAGAGSIHPTDNLHSNPCFVATLQILSQDECQLSPVAHDEDHAAVERDEREVARDGHDPGAHRVRDRLLRGLLRPAGGVQPWRYCIPLN